ncbi:DUF4376 domain-containing protein [Pseudomonas nicosulfuronedens]
MAHFALVNIATGLVENTAVWDGESEWSAPAGFEAVQSDEAGIGWSYADGVFTAPVMPATPPLTIEELKAGIAARRYQAETAGIDFDGMPLDTGRDSQALVTGAALAAVIDPTYHCQWKTESGFIDLDAQQIIAIASVMRAHVQACFDHEAALLDALVAGTFTDDQLEQGWPA